MSAVLTSVSKISDECSSCVVLRADRLEDTLLRQNPLSIWVTSQSFFSTVNAPRLHPADHLAWRWPLDAGT